MNEQQRLAKLEAAAAVAMPNTVTECRDYFNSAEDRVIEANWMVSKFISNVDKHAAGGLKLFLKECTDEQIQRLLTLIQNYVIG